MVSIVHLYFAGKTICIGVHENVLPSQGIKEPKRGSVQGSCSFNPHPHLSLLLSSSLNTLIYMQLNLVFPNADTSQPIIITDHSIPSDSDNQSQSPIKHVAKSGGNSEEPERVSEQGSCS